MDEREYPLPNGGYARMARRDGAGRPVVLLHGSLGSWRTWADLLHEEDDPFHGRPVLALDLRGHGKSVKAESGYTVDQFAQDALGAFDAAAAWPAILIGERLGALVAMEIVRQRPHDTLELILVEPPLPGPEQGVETDDFWEAEADLFAWQAELQRQPLPVIEKSLDQIYPELPTLVIARKAVALQQVAPAYFDAVLDGSAATPDFLQRFSPDGRGALLLRGADRSRSGLAEAGTIALQELYPRITQGTVSGGHAMLDENPAGVADAIRTFLA